MWKKKGLIFCTDNNFDWMTTHAQVPTAFPIDDNLIRIFFAVRNKENKSFTTYVDVLAENPSKIVYKHDKPILPLGKLATFDDSGVMPSSVVSHKDNLYLYYTGWNLAVNVPYLNSIGLACSKDNGRNWVRMFEGPIVSRTPLEPYFAVTPYVMKDDHHWHMWYASTIRFVLVNDKQEPQYIIKYAYSPDGVEWIQENITCIHPKTEFEANARPTVIKENGLFKMWFCYRTTFDFRDGKNSYRIGYAESKDGLKWDRKDELSGIDVSNEGWDSSMLTYPYVLQHKGKKYLFYNGNTFGKSGFGYAMS